MSRFSEPLLLAAALFVVTAALASPAVADVDSTCFATAGDEQISGCSRLIQDRDFSSLQRVTAYNSRGLAYYAKGELDRAIADYNEAIRLDPKQPFVYLNRGEAYRAKGDFDRAINDYDEALQLDPELAMAYLDRGRAKQAKGDSNEGDADIAKAKQLDPQKSQSPTAIWICPILGNCGPAGTPRLGQW